MVKKLLWTITLVMTVFSSGMILQAKGINNRPIIWVNNIEVQGEYLILNEQYDILVPLRAVLESLGTEVEWEEETGRIYFQLNGVNYACKFMELSPGIPESKSIYISKLESIDSKRDLDYIQLHPMSAGGFYCMINDRTYLYQETAKRLFEALGCKVEIDPNTHTMRISD